MERHVLKVLAGAVLALAALLRPAAAQAPLDQGKLFVAYFVQDQGIHRATEELIDAAQTACGGGPAGDLKFESCLIDRVAAALPHGDAMSPYCSQVADVINRYFCVVMGALMTDLVDQTDAVEPEPFLSDHGSERDQIYTTAGPLVIASLQAKCPPATAESGCAVVEAAARLESDDADRSVCAGEADEWTAVDCLLTRRAVRIVRDATGKF